jgi:hypothetical protein
MTDESVLAYSGVEEIVRQAVIAHCPEFVDSYRCQAGNLDEVLSSMFESDSEKYGIYLDFGGGLRPIEKETFYGRIWEWSVAGVGMVKFTGLEQVEQDARTLIDRLATLFLKDHTINKQVIRAQILSIEPAQAITVNERRMYWIPFNMSVTAKLS